MKRRLRNILIFFISLATITVGFSDWFVVAKKEIVISPQTSTVRAVAYIKSKPTVKYTSIEKALEVAAANSIKDQIFVLPGTNPTITRNVTIAANDELILPYVGETYQDTGRTKTGIFADSSASGVTTYRKNVVTISANVTLTVAQNAKLIIGGVLGHNNQQSVGQTNGDYVEVNMRENAKIINHGTIDTFGYIKEYDFNNGSTIYAKGTSTIKLPFVIYDFRGGGFTNAANDKKVLPFNIFDFPNIKSVMEVEYGANVVGIVTIPASGSVTKSEGTLIGSNGLFRQSVGSLIVVKYHGSSLLYTTRDAVRATNNENLINRTIIDLYGTASVSSISMSAINTENFFLAFSYKFHLNIKTNAVINISEKMKFLKGTQVIIESGATVNMSKEVIFYQNYFEEATTAGQFYPTLYENVPAKLINNGNLNISSKFAGKIETTSTTGIVNTSYDDFVSEVVSLEMITGAGSFSISEQTWKEVTGYGIAHISETSNPGMTVSRIAKNELYEAQTTWWLGNPGTGETVEVIGPLQERESGSCLTFDTLITMADGSYKMVGDIRAGDLVQVFNHEIGEIEIAPITFNDDIDTDYELFNVLYLEFSNNKTVKVVYEHGFFDLDTMQYEYIDEHNFESFIGHRFVEISNNELSEVTLDNAYVVVEETKIVSPVSYYHLNIIIEDLLSMPGGIPGLFNIFEHASNLAYDEVKKAADIEEYGLFTYDDFKDRVPYEFYAAFPTPYLKVSLGKGLITEDFIEYLIRRYLPVASEQT